MKLSSAAGCCAVAVVAAMGLPRGEGADGPATHEPTRAVWIWARTVRSQGAEKVAACLEGARINTVFLLVKGTSGATSFPSRLALRTEPGGDVLREVLDACRPRGIRVHAWVVFNGDQEWVKAHPGDAMHSCGAPDGSAPQPGTERVCPAAEAYRLYLKGIAREMLAGHAVDGIHLDYIRYPSLATCFCPRHQRKARERGIDFERVRQAATRATHERGAREHFVSLYRQGDPDVRGWVALRQEEIDSFAREVREIVRETRPAAQLSAALMPEGAESDDAYALCHYAQNYRSVGGTCDFICPMSYHASYGKPAVWPAEIAGRAAARSGRPALAGLQAFDAATATGLGQAIREAERRRLPGFVLFHYGSMTAARWAQLRE